MSFTSIKKIIPKSVKAAGIQNNLNEAKILENFNETAAKVFGDRVLKKIKPLYIKDGTLMVACLSDVLAQYIRENERRFLFELNRPFGKGIIEKIRFLA
ncbi:MAG: DUF721 domain-containing protein [Candidatus Buchananbacteria bacterium]